MTFDKWLEQYEPTAPKILDDCARAAWIAETNAERKRCAEVLRYWITGYAPKEGTHEARCVAHILDGRPAHDWSNAKLRPTGARLSRQVEP